MHRPSLGVKLVGAFKEEGIKYTHTGNLRLLFSVKLLPTTERGAVLLKDTTGAGAELACFDGENIEEGLDEEEIKVVLVSSSTAIAEMLALLAEEGDGVILSDWISSRSNSSPVCAALCFC